MTPKKLPIILLIAIILETTAYGTNPSASTIRPIVTAHAKEDITLIDIYADQLRGFFAFHSYDVSAKGKNVSHIV